MHTAAAVFLLAGQCSQLRWDPAASYAGCEQDRTDALRHAETVLVDVRKFEELAEWIGKRLEMATLKAAARN